MQSWLGLLVMAPVNLTHNECIVCHWYRALVLGIAIGLAVGAFYKAALVCFLLVVILVLFERLAKPDGEEVTQ